MVLLAINILVRKVVNYQHFTERQSDKIHFCVTYFKPVSLLGKRP